MNIKKLRESKKMSQGKLARVSGVAQSTISYIESGQKNPSIATVLKLAKALDIDVNALIQSN